MQNGGVSIKPPPLVQDLGWRGILADLRLTSDMEFGDILGVLGSVLRHVESVGLVKLCFSGLFSAKIL